MKIGVDATCWDNKRGYGRFTRELLNELVQIDQANEYLFFMDQNGAKLFDLPKTVRKIVANTDQSPIVAAAAGKNRTIRDIWAMSREVMRHKVDLFFYL